MIDKIKIIVKDVNINYLRNNYNWQEKKDIDKENVIPSSKRLYRYNLTHKSKTFKLRLLLTENLKTKQTTLSIDGSIRKWYFGKNTRKDLNYKEFIECIEIIESKIGLKEGEIWLKSNITKLEIGVTLLLRNFTIDILNCFVKYKQAKRDISYVTTLYFKQTNYELKFYDKYLEIHKKDKKKLIKYNEVISKKLLLLRFEISIEKVSDPAFKTKYKNLQTLKSNWNQIPKDLNNYLKNITFLDIYADEKKIVPNNITALKNYAYYVYTKEVGITETIKIISNFENNTNKSKHMNELQYIYNTLTCNKNNYRRKILCELDKKTKRLSI